MENYCKRNAHTNSDERSEGLTERSFKKNVTIEPGCITCGACEFICPAVFEVTDICRVKQNAPINDQQDSVRQAAQACPVQVIKVEEE